MIEYCREGLKKSNSIYGEELANEVADYEAKIAKLKEIHLARSSIIMTRQRLLVREFSKAVTLVEADKTCYLPTTPDPNVYRLIEPGLVFEKHKKYFGKIGTGAARIFVRRILDQFYFVEVLGLPESFVVSVISCRLNANKTQGAIRTELASFPADKSPIGEIKVCAHSRTRFCVKIANSFWSVSTIDLSAQKIPNIANYNFAIYSGSSACGMLLFKCTEIEDGYQLEYSDGTPSTTLGRVKVIDAQNLVLDYGDGKLAIFMPGGPDPADSMCEPGFHRVKLSLFLDSTTLRFVRVDGKDRILYDDGYNDTCYSFY
jgi:hypothetical protein